MLLERFQSEQNEGRAFALHPDHAAVRFITSCINDPLSSTRYVQELLVNTMQNQRIERPINTQERPINTQERQINMQAQHIPTAIPLSRHPRETLVSNTGNIGSRASHTVLRDSDGSANARKSNPTTTRRPNQTDPSNLTNRLEDSRIERDNSFGMIQDECKSLPVSLHNRNRDAPAPNEPGNPACQHGVLISALHRMQSLEQRLSDADRRFVFYLCNSIWL